MEQKQIDEIEDSYLSEEFIDEDDLDSFDGEQVKKIRKTPLKKNHKLAPDKKVHEERHKEELRLEKRDTARKEELRKDSGIKIVPLKEEKFKEEKKEEHREEKPVPKVVETAKSYDPWEDEKGSESSSGLFKSAGPWKFLTLVMAILLVFSLLTNGFNFSNSAVTGAATISLSEAEQKTLGYVNSNLLQEPFVAELKSSEDLGSLYKMTLTVAGQEIESYLTKDGEMFFPQGFETDLNLAALANNSAATETAPIIVKDVSADDDAVKGSAQAPVTIIEFSDYQCPYCAKYVKETQAQIMAQYVETGQVRYVFRDFPLTFHAEAQKAAEAAECAGEQDQYWEMHDYLFENNDYLTVENLKGYAADLKLDIKKFNNCLDQGTMAEEVKKDLADGKKYGVQGTPGFFINGKLISGAQPFSVFKKEIEAALAAAESEPVIKEETVPAKEETVPGQEIELPIVEEQEPTPVIIPPTEQEFTVQAKKWLFNPREITVAKGTPVRLTIVPSELQFTFSLPGYGIEKEISGTTTIEFTADQTGTFEFKCSSCEDWRGMTGTIKVN